MLDNGFVNVRCKWELFDKYQSCELTCKSAHSSHGCNEKCTQYAKGKMDDEMDETDCFGKCVGGEESCFAECEVGQMACEAKCNEDFQDDPDDPYLEKLRKCFGYWLDW